MPWVSEFFDDFDRADGPIGSPWTTPAFSNSWQIEDSQARGGESGWTSVTYPGETSSADQAIEVTTRNSANSCDNTLVLRSAGSNFQGEDGMRIRLTNREVWFNESYQSPDIPTYGSNPTLRAEVIDDEVNFYVEGNLVKTMTANRAGGSGSNFAGIGGRSNTPGYDSAETFVWSDDPPPPPPPPLPPPFIDQFNGPNPDEFWTFSDGDLEIDGRLTLKHTDGMSGLGRDVGDLVMSGNYLTMLEVDFSQIGGSFAGMDVYKFSGPILEFYTLGSTELYTYFFDGVDFQNDQVQGPFDPSDYTDLRIREDSGTIYWEGRTESGWQELMSQEFDVSDGGWEVLFFFWPDGEDDTFSIGEFSYLDSEPPPPPPPFSGGNSLLPFNRKVRYLSCP